MRTRFRIVAALASGAIFLFLGMAIVDHFFWAGCSGVDIHRYHEIWICWYFLHLWVVSAFIAGLLAGLMVRTRGIATGAIVAVGALILFTLSIRYPFGIDNVATLKYGLLFFVGPSVLGCVLGARFFSGEWKHAL